MPPRRSKRAAPAAASPSKKARAGPAAHLAGTAWFVMGTFSMKKAGVEDRLKALGASVMASIKRGVTHILCGDDEVGKMSAKVLKAIDLKLPLLKESYLQACEASGSRVCLGPPYVHVVSVLPSCPYGMGCYRMNPDHFKEASHPYGHKVAMQYHAMLQNVPPLVGTTWVITGTLSETRAKISKRLEGLGAAVAASFTKVVTHILAGDDEVAKGSAKVRKARDLDIPLLRESYLLACEASTSFVAMAPPHLHGAIGGGSAVVAAHVPAKPAAVKPVGDPLAGTTWVITGTLTETRPKMAARLRDLGAKVASSFSKSVTVTHVLAGDDEVAKGSTKVLKAVDLKVPLVKEGYVIACETFGKVALGPGYVHHYGGGAGSGWGGRP